MSNKRYKVWLHLEEITLDEEGIVIDYINLDGEMLPLPVGEFDDKDEATSFMTHLYNSYFL